jgi:hypothetical protein
VKAFHAYVGLDGRTIAVWRPPGPIDPLGVGTVHFAESQTEVDDWMPYLRRGERPPQPELAIPQHDESRGHFAREPQPDLLLDEL